MFKIDKHPRARRDLVEIWRYTAEHWSEGQADRYLRLIDTTIQQLRSNPRLGSDYGHVRPGLRGYPAERHRIFYMLSGRTIEIVRFFMAAWTLRRICPGMKPEGGYSTQSSPISR